MTPQLFQSLKAKSDSFRFEDYGPRKRRLQKLLHWVQTHEKDILNALKNDFNKPHFETLISEIRPVTGELKYAISRLKCWMKNKCVRTPAILAGHKSYIRYENKGVVLIIAPWNYPFQLAIAPLIAALAAGNTCVIKPSELTPATSDLIKKMVTDCFNEDEVTVELGAKEKSQELLSYNFDHVFFTGSTAVGRIVAKSCAERLIPVTLELGGKSPVIVDQTADLTDAAEKIFWGKFLNRAQTCIAPDYLLVHGSVATELMRELQQLSEKNQKTEKAKIITENHRARLQNLSGAQENLNEKALELKEVSVADPLMKDELFGPVLPFLKFKTRDELKKLVLTDEKPLSLYVFSKDSDFVEFVLNSFPSGGAAVNSVLLHFANHHLPFGGIGASGMGRYHGHHGFLEMSHARAVVDQKMFSFSRKLLLPPYPAWKYKLLKFLP